MGKEQRDWSIQSVQSYPSGALGPEGNQVALAGSIDVRTDGVKPPSPSRSAL